MACLFILFFKYCFDGGKRSVTQEKKKKVGEGAQVVSSKVIGRSRKREEGRLENLHRLMASLPPTAVETSAIDASAMFDKQALLQRHDLVRRNMENLPVDSFVTNLSLGDTIDGRFAAYSVSLESLNPISLTQLQIGQVHRGRVLYGTLCAEAFRMVGIITLLEDGNGLAVRLGIYNVLHSQTNVERLYPRGAKVAVKEPYLKRTLDDVLCIRVDSPAKVEILVDVEEMKNKGNVCLREKQWDKAAEHYTKCIDAALLQIRIRFPNDENTIKTCLLHAYSNRAETRLKVAEFERALDDSNKALEIQSANILALKRKGCALSGLKQHVAACECLKEAAQLSRGNKDIEDALRQARIEMNRPR